MPDRIVIPTIPELKKFEINNSELGVGFVRLSPGSNNLEIIKLVLVEMSILAWRELFISINRLPQSVTVVLDRITLSDEQWTELMFDIKDNVSNSVHVYVESFSNPSED